MARIVVKSTEFFREPEDGPTESSFGYTVYVDDYYGEDGGLDSYAVGFSSRQEVREALVPGEICETLKDNTPGFDLESIIFDDENDVTFEVDGREFSYQDVIAAGGELK